MVSEAYRVGVAYEIAHPRQSVRAAVPELGLGPGQRLLDVGCGGGLHLGLFARAVAPGGQIVGLDLDADSLALAAEHWAGEIAAGTIALREGDHDAIPARDGEFDLAWSSAVLHHAERPATLLGEMARVVRPGGLVAVLDSDTGGSFPVLPWPPALEQRLRAASLAGQEANFHGKLGHHFAGYVGRQLPRLLREAGLRDIQLHALPEVDHPPLSPQREAEICAWFTGPFARRMFDFLSPDDLTQLLAFFDPDSPDYLPTSPDFFLARVMFLGAGRVPE